MTHFLHPITTMRRLLLAALCMAAVAAHAQKTPVWKDPAVNQVNREARRAAFFAFEDADKAIRALEAAGEKAYLIGSIAAGEKGVDVC